MDRPIGDQQRARSGIEEGAAEPRGRLGAGARRRAGVAGGEHDPIRVELEREDLLHRQQPVALDAGDLGRAQRQRRLGQAVEIAGDEAVGGESDDPVAREILVLDVLFVGGAPEKQRLRRIDVERARHRGQLFARVGEPRQHRQLRLVDALGVGRRAQFERRAARDIGARVRIARRGVGDLAAGAACSASASAASSGEK